MRKMGIETGADLQALDEAELVRRFGKVGRHYFRIVRGLDERPVRPDRRRKSVGAERTFLEDIDDVTEMEEKVEEIAEHVARRLRRVDTRGRTVTLKIKYHDFVVRTRSRTLPHNVESARDIAAAGCELLHTPAPPTRAVRLLGLTVSNLDNEDHREDDHQLRLL